MLAQNHEYHSVVIANLMITRTKTKNITHESDYLISVAISDLII